MNKKTLYYPVLFLLIMQACATRQTTKDDAEANKLYKKVNVANISFFGTIKIDSSEKIKRPITLFYDEAGKLIKLQAGARNAPYYFLNRDGANMLVSRRRSPRYVDVDTLLFFKEKCYRKLVNYLPNSNGQPEKWAGMTEFMLYSYKEDGRLWLSINSYSANDSLHAHESLVIFAQKNEAGTQRALAPYIKTELAGGEKELSKLSFFRNHIML